MEMPGDTHTHTQAHVCVFVCRHVAEWMDGLVKGVGEGYKRRGGRTANEDERVRGCLPPS